MKGRILPLLFLFVSLITLSSCRSFYDDNDDIDPPVTGPTEGNQLDANFDVVLDKIIEDSLIDHRRFIDPFSPKEVTRVHFTQDFNGRQIPVVADYHPVNVSGLIGLELNRGFGVQLYKTRFNNILMKMSLQKDLLDIKAKGVVSLLGVGSTFEMEAFIDKIDIRCELHFHPDSLIYVKNITSSNKGIRMSVTPTDNNRVDVKKMLDASMETFQHLVMRLTNAVGTRVLANLNLKPLKPILKQYLIDA